MRNSAMTFQIRTGVSRWARFGVAGPGRFRQFYQCDADTAGGLNGGGCRNLRDVVGCFETLGLGGDYIVKINNRKVLNGAMEVSGRE